MKNCIIVSQSSFLSDFARMLNDSGWQIKAIFTDIYDIDLPSANITCNSLNQFAKDIENITTDYIFSIVNPIIFSKQVFKKAICINYHPSLLPHYAGVCPTSLAIYNSERISGYTWHFMSEEIDQGEIIFQSSVKILHNDTAKSLSLRCYKRAIYEFPNVLEIILKKTKTHKKFVKLIIMDIRTSRISYLIILMIKKLKSF